MQKMKKYQVTSDTHRKLHAISPIEKGLNFWQCKQRKLRMAAAVVHETNNPLASVLNLIFLARQDDTSKQKIKSYLATAESELERVPS